MSANEKGGEKFELPIGYRGGEKMVPCRLVTMGYSYKIYAQVGEHEIIFEPDEERHFRAVMEDQDVRSKMDIDIVRAIGEALEKHLGVQE